MRSHNRLAFEIRDILLSYGFVIVMVLVFVFFSLSTPNFFSIRNVLRILHTAAPLMILSSGLALVVIMGSLDISVGTVMFLSCGTAAALMAHQDVPPVLGVLIALLIGAAFGALNGFIVVALKINPLITTMGTMIALRGVGLQVTNSMVVRMPEELRRLGSAKIGPVFIDILFAFAIVLLFHFVHTRTRFGRHITAIGNGAQVAQRLGVRVRRVTFVAFVLSGLMASIGGLFTVFQLGAVTATFGIGYEFSAIALIVIGGISLFGGEGSILGGLTLGAWTLTVIESGLNFMGASPYAYPFVRGGIIFVAMYADSLKSLVHTQGHVTIEGDIPREGHSQAAGR